MFSQYLKVKIILVFILLPVVTVGARQLRGCNKLKSGHFYYYPSHSKDSALIIRKDKLQSEVNLATGDTTIYQITWNSQCAFRASFVRRTKPFEKGEEFFVKTHDVHSQVIFQTDKYYVFKALLMPAVGEKTVSDTVWLSRK